MHVRLFSLLVYLSAEVTEEVKQQIDLFSISGFLVVFILLNLPAIIMWCDFETARFRMVSASVPPPNFLCHSAVFICEQGDHGLTWSLDSKNFH